MRFLLICASLFFMLTTITGQTLIEEIYSSQSPRDQLEKTLRHSDYVFEATLVNSEKLEKSEGTLIQSTFNIEKILKGQEAQETIQVVTSETKMVAALNEIQPESGNDLALVPKKPGNPTILFLTKSEDGSYYEPIMTNISLSYNIEGNDIRDKKVNHLIYQRFGGGDISFKRAKEFYQFSERITNQKPIDVTGKKFVAQKNRRKKCCNH